MDSGTATTRCLPAGPQHFFPRAREGTAPKPCAGIPSHATSLFPKPAGSRDRCRPRKATPCDFRERRLWQSGSLCLSIDRGSQSLFITAGWEGGSWEEREQQSEKGKAGSGSAGVIFFPPLMLLGRGGYRHRPCITPAASCRQEGPPEKKSARGYFGADGGNSG